MARSALWIGDQVHGKNRHTGDEVRGTLTSITVSDLDGVAYAEVNQPGTGPQTIEASALIGPRRCYRAQPALDDRGYAADRKDGEADYHCVNCGRELWGYPNPDADWGTSWTHQYSNVPARFRS